MEPPKVKPGKAVASEERYRASFRAAVLEHLGKTPERAAWCDAALDILWEYDGMSPYSVAAIAWRKGYRALHERALADDRRLTDLAKAAKVSE